ncbi:hypothetical protein GCM10010407_08180 [Rarobacter incanus]
MQFAFEIGGIAALDYQRIHVSAPETNPHSGPGNHLVVVFYRHCVVKFTIQVRHTDVRDDPHNGVRSGDGHPGRPPLAALTRARQTREGQLIACVVSCHGDIPSQGTDIVELIRARQELECCGGA